MTEQPGPQDAGGAGENPRQPQSAAPPHDDALADPNDEDITES